MIIPESQLILRASALSSGCTDDELARMRRRGAIQSLQRGAYIPANAPAAVDQRERHRAKIRATVAGLRLPAVISHTSAAVLHGLPLWAVRLGPVQVTRRPPFSGDRSARLHVHVSRIEDDEVCVVDGLSVTTVTRTLLDLGRSLSLESAVVAADFALHEAMTTPNALQAMARNQSGVPGSLQATRMAAFADGGSDSVGESRSRVAIARLELPSPTLQMEIRSESGQRVGVCDFGWREDRVVGEFDGKVKYGRLVKPGQSAGDVVFAEKRREDAIREAGWEVVRWVWDDLGSPGVIGQRIRRAQERTRRRR